MQKPYYSFDGKAVSSLKDLPEGDSFVVLKNDSRSYTVDYGPPDRPETCTDNFLSVVRFTDKAKWEEYVAQSKDVIDGKETPAIIRRPKVRVKTTIDVKTTW